MQIEELSNLAELHINETQIRDLKPLEKCTSLQILECKKLELDEIELMSGPFHDALALSYACDYAMIFVRCKDGISHNPLEFASYDDLALGANVLLGTVMQILKNHISHKAKY